MSKYQPKTGDRVRVVLEGEVFAHPGSKEFEIGNHFSNSIHADAGHLMSIEKLEDPEPVSGSVVLDGEGDAWQRQSLNGLWQVVGESDDPWIWSKLNAYYSPLKVIYTP